MSVPGDPERRPAFARDFPRTPALDALVDAFARGDYARVRAEGPKLAESESDDAVRLAARALVAHTGADALAIWLLVIAGALLVVVSVYWIMQQRMSAPQDVQPSTIMSRARSTPAAT
jgi:hypothetical protein